MTNRYGIGFIGLGSIGQRMLDRAAGHDRIRPAVAWDPQSDRLADTVARHPGLHPAADAAALIADDRVDLVYIASPPLTHADHACAAIAAGKPVLCEKPLGVDLETSRQLVARAGTAAVPNAVNFIYASARPAETLATALTARELGQIHGVDIDLHLPEWAATRTAEAPWLADRDQGGFVREVLSHYIYLSERLFGPARMRFAHCQFAESPGGAATRLIAALDCDGLPVHIHGTTLGAGPDVKHYTVWGEQRSYRIHDLFSLQTSTGGDWQDAYDHGSDPAGDWHRRQYDGVADLLDGGESGLPAFAAGLSVQTLIEAMLKN